MIQKVVVVPGQVVGNNSKYLPGHGTFKNRKNEIIAVRMGFINKKDKYINVIPFKDFYLPKQGDQVIGKVYDKNPVLWKLDINSPYIAILRPSDIPRERQNRGRFRNTGSGRRGRLHSSRLKTTEKYNVGDMLIGKISGFKEAGEASFSIFGSNQSGKLTGGTITEISLPKIPSLIGHSGSMIKLITKHVSCKLFVADNGVVWIRARNPLDERIVVDTIKKIDNDAFAPDLEERVKEYLDDVGK